MGALQGLRSIGVTFAISRTVEDIGYTEIYFMEFSRKGKPRGKPTKLNLKYDGKNQHSLVFKPIWNGKWQILVSHAYFDNGLDATDALSNELILFTITGKANNWQVRRRVLENDGQPEMAFAYRSISQVSEFNPAANSSNLESFKVFLMHFESLPNWQKSQNPYKCQYRILEITPNGKIKQDLKVNIPKWKPTNTYPVPLSNRLNTITLIRPGERDFQQTLSDDHLYLAQARSIVVQRKLGFPTMENTSWICGK